MKTNMRNRLLGAIALTLSLSMVSTSCIGSFGLTNRLLNWNKGVGSKFVNELVFFAFWILPVYEVCGLADILVINSIEFWSGSNPMAKGTKVIEGEDGRYLVQCDGKGYTITSENDGSKVRLDFDEDTDTWSVDLGEEGGSYKLMTIVDDTHVMLPADAKGNMRLVEVSQEGAWAYQQYATGRQLASNN